MVELAFHPAPFRVKPEEGLFYLRFSTEPAPGPLTGKL